MSKSDVVLRIKTFSSVDELFEPKGNSNDMTVAENNTVEEKAVIEISVPEDFN